MSKFALALTSRVCDVAGVSKCFIVPRHRPLIEKLNYKFTTYPAMFTYILLCTVPRLACLSTTRMSEHWLCVVCAALALVWFFIGFTVLLLPAYKNHLFDEIKSSAKLNSVSTPFKMSSILGVI